MGFSTMSLENKPLIAAIDDFIHFLRAQRGAYGDACAGYRRNHVSVKMRVMKSLKRANRTLTDKAGPPSVVMTNVKDPRAPDSVVHTIRLSREFLAANAAGGGNEQQFCRALIVFIFTFWDDVTRYECAKALGTEKNDVKLPIAGDLRILRHAILHDRGVLRAAAHKKLEVIGSSFEPDAEVNFSNGSMMEIFNQLDAQIAAFAARELDIPSPPGGWKDITKIAFARDRAE